jgi:acyl-coenzyme A synthetase/AMP-(fatty) acid ligase
MARFWDIRDDDVFFCTSEIGWVVGHSYIVYAPPLAGATTLSARVWTAISFSVLPALLHHVDRPPAIKR